MSEVLSGLDHSRGRGGSLLTDLRSAVGRGFPPAWGGLLRASRVESPVSRLFSIARYPELSDMGTPGCSTVVDGS